MSRYKAIKGIKDILPENITIWHHIEQEARSLFESFTFSELRLPILEYTELFARGIGEATDIVEKEMYTFTDRDERKITLRPEGTAGIVRAYIEHYMYKREPISKLYYIGPMFRHERPQAGRLRQFYQIGAELIGSDSALSDTEVIYMLYRLFINLNIQEFTLEINSLGCTDCRPKYINALKSAINNKKDQLCDSCKRRLNLNPLRILDCKRELCKELTSDTPTTIEYLCDSCSNHHNQVTSTLEKLKVPFKNNTRIVRGLDYYTRTTFEFTSNNLGAQNAIAAGGRYDGLIQQLGGPKLPAVGFAMGIERLAILLNDKKISDNRPKLYVAALGGKAIEYMLELTFQLRSAKIIVGMEFEEKSLKTLMKKADQFGADWTIIVGENEITKNSAVIRNMTTKKQVDILLPTTVEHIKNIINQT